MAVQRAEAIYNFEPTADVELQLKKGDVVTVHRTNVGDGWWEGELNGQRGLFPSSFVKLLPTSPQHGLGTVQTGGLIPSTGTPRLSRKLCMDTLLAPGTVSSYSTEKAAEIFIQGRDEIHVLAGPKWDDSKVTPLTISVSYYASERSSEVKVFANYNVKTKELSSHVIRNYKHFLALYDRFAEYFPCISLPPLPVKQLTSSSDVAALEARRRRLEKFLTKIARHPLLGATKLFHEFLTVNDEKDWKIGKQVKVSKSAKKIFQAPIYYVVQYPVYNIPVTQLSSIEKFCAFGKLAQKNFAHIHQSYQQHGMAEAGVMSSLNNLGHDFKRFSRGMLPVVDAQHRKLQALVSNAVSGDKVEQNSSDEGEESSWNWRDDPKFTLLVHYLSDVGYAIQDVANAYKEHQDRLEQSIVEGFAEYSNIFHTLPELVKLHEEATEVFNTSKEKDSKKEAEEVREHCNTLSNILMAEFDHISNSMTSDLQTITSKFLRLQADFHSKVAAKWQTLYDRHRRTSDDSISVDGDLWNISRPSSLHSSSSSHKVPTSRRGSTNSVDDGLEREEGGEGGSGPGQGRGPEKTANETVVSEPLHGQDGVAGSDYDVPNVAGKERPDSKMQEVDCSHYKNWQFALMLEKKKEVAEVPAPVNTPIFTPSLSKSAVSEQSKKPCPPPKVLKPSSNQDDYSVPWDIQSKLTPPPPPPSAPLAQSPDNPLSTANLVHTSYSKVTVAPDKPLHVPALTPDKPPHIPALAPDDDDNKPAAPPPENSATMVHQRALLPKQTSRGSVTALKKQPLLPPKKPITYYRTASKDMVDDNSYEALPPGSSQQDVAVVTGSAAVPPPKPPHHPVADATPTGSSKVKAKEPPTKLTIRKPKMDQPSSDPVLPPPPPPPGEFGVKFIAEKQRDSSSSSVVVSYVTNASGKEDCTSIGGAGERESTSNLSKYGIIEDGGGGTYII